MSEDVEKDEESEMSEGRRRRLFWILVVSVFAAVVIIWLSFFSDTIFNVNTTTPEMLFKNLGSYWNGAKGGFLNKFEQLTATSTETTTENQATSTQ